MKNKFAFFIDVIFLGSIIFILSLVLLNYFLPHPFTVIYSACLALLAVIFFFARLDKRRKISLSKIKEEKEKTKLISELNFMDRAEQNALIERALKNAGETPERRRGIIVLKDKNAVILSRFSFNKVSKADIVRAFNVINLNQKAFILAQSFDDDLWSFAARFDDRVKLINGDSVYKYLKDNDALPNEYKYECFLERKKKGSLKNLLDKKKAKTFLVFGALFLLFSYISPLKTYYIVCGCLFLIYSLILRLWGKQINLDVQTDNI